MNPIPPPIQALLELFATTLSDVRFADVDGPTLARCATEVEAAAKAVAVAQGSLDAAMASYREKQELLLQRSQRALAYARVFAEGDDALGRQLEAVTLPKPTKRARAEETLVLTTAPEAPPRPRGRPKKAKDPGLTLEAIVPSAE
jgi:hypothetical protein